MAEQAEIQDILNKISQQKLILFFGAGASVDAQGPSTSDLVQSIKKRFSNAEYTSDDFIQTCTEVMETTYTSRYDLETFIKKNLYDIKPSQFHLQLPLSIWPAIFTTNYDDVIENAYRENINRVQIIDLVFNDNDSLTLHDREKVKIFKLMGCISSQHPDNKMVLTREDYTNAIRTRTRVFKTLQDIMRDGTILYVGYSFKDYLLQDIINDLIQGIGLSKLPYSYALMPDLEPSSVQAQKLREKKVLPLLMTASSFSEILKTGVKFKLTPLKDKQDTRINIKGGLRFIPHRDARSYSQSFEFLSEDTFTNVQDDNDETRRDFFRGVLKDWTGYIRDWDFKRIQYNELFSIVQEELSNSDVRNNKSLMLFGPAGAGKTILFHRLAIDAYRKLGNPVILLRPFYEDMDFKSLSTLCESLSTWEKETKGRKNSYQVRVLILMESASSHILDFKTLSTFMKSRGIPVLLIASSRENEWLKVCEKNNYPSHVENTFSLNDTFESVIERQNFIEHLKRLGILGAELTNDHIASIISKDYHDSFFASIYSLVEPSRPSLDEKISDEFQNLSEMAKQAYIYIASFFQYSLPLPIELLVRTLDCSYKQFLAEIYEGDAKKVICEVPAPFESVFYGLRHRIIAERIIDKHIADMEELTSILTKLLSSINNTNSEEVDICKSLLIRYVGPNGIEWRLSQKQIRDLFSAAIDIGELKEPSILHHFGLFESDNQQQDKAVELLELALKQLKNRDFLPFKRSERVENVYNTLGVVYSRKGQASELDGDNESAEVFFSTATDYFSKAKGTVSPNAYPYDSETRMYIYRAERTEEPRDKLLHYVSALEVIEEAEDNLPDEEMPRFQLLEVKIQEDIKNIKEASLVITDMQKDPDSRELGYRIGIRLYLLQSSQTNEKLQKAFGILKKTISVGTPEPSSLRLYTRLFRLLYPDDHEGLYSILKNRYQFPQEKRNLTLLYELGKLAFTFSEYPASREYFSELERISQGHSKRWGILDKGVNSSGDVLEFNGSVVQIGSTRVGTVDIPQLRLRVPFLPYAQKFQPELGENVTFNIGFSYRGWLAIDLVH